MRDSACVDRVDGVPDNPGVVLNEDPRGAINLEPGGRDVSGSEAGAGLQKGLLTCGIDGRGTVVDGGEVEFAGATADAEAERKTVA